MNDDFSQPRYAGVDIYSLNTSDIRKIVSSKNAYNYWVSEGNRVWHVEKLEDSHLLNIVAFLKKKGKKINPGIAAELKKRFPEKYAFNVLTGDVQRK